MGFVPFTNVVWCPVAVISPNRPVVHMSSCFVRIMSIFVPVSLLLICPRSIVSLQSVRFVGSPGPFVSVDSFFVESFAFRRRERKVFRS